jgi:hypothetical protein
MEKQKLDINIIKSYIEEYHFKNHALNKLYIDLYNFVLTLIIKITIM